jgi:hypothetical protein
MAQTADNTKKPKDQTTPNPSSANSPVPQDDFANFRDHFNKAPREAQESFLKSLGPEERVDFATKMGWFGHIKAFSASPKAGTIPWMKEKAYSMLDWTANQLPTIGGIGGGFGGGVVGELIDPLGGGVPGGIIGSGVGGGVGEAARQGILHAQGYDKYDSPESKTLGRRSLGVAEEFVGQAVGEAVGQGFGKLLRPTLERSLAKLYYSGGIKYGNPLGKGDLESVVDDIMKTEKSGLGKATTVGDFLNVVKQTKEDIGREVDNQLALPINQNGKMVMLGQAHADSRPIVTAIQNMATADPSIVKEAAINKAGKEAAYLEHIRQEALKFSQTPWTYQELTSKRIRLNNELAALYEQPPGLQRAYLLDHPNLAVAKAEADAIRDVVYPKMDILTGKPMGTTAELQGKRGSLMSIENQVNEHLAKLKTAARQAKGAPPLEKANVSTYGTSAGKPGFAVHRLTGLVHTPNPEAKADRQVAKAFVHGVGPNLRKGLSTKAGQELMSVPTRLLAKPLRELINPTQNDTEENDAPEPQSSVTQSPRELLQKAKSLNPAAAGQTAYNHTAVNPATGHRIKSSDGRVWYDEQTGQQVA